MKYRVGDLVKIIGNSNNHHFIIGEVGRIRKISDSGIKEYVVEYLDKHDYWYVKEDDMTLANEKTKRS